MRMDKNKTEELLESDGIEMKIAQAVENTLVNDFLFVYSIFISY